MNAPRGYLRVQRLLRARAAELASLFEGPPRKGGAIVHHAWGHATRLLVRLRDARAEALGRRVAPLMGPAAAARRREDAARRTLKAKRR